MSIRPLAGDRVNPVLARELTERMRRRNTPVILTIFLLAMLGIFASVFQALLRSGRAFQCIDGECFEQLNVVQFAGAGRQLFLNLLFFAVLLACFIVPALTAGAIAGERERQTLVPLLLTLLKPRQIVLGKLSSSLAFMLFLFAATLPLVGVTFLIGGVGMKEVLLGSVMVVAVCITLGAVAIMCSSLVRRSQAATVASYGLVFVLAVGTFVPITLYAVSERDDPVRPATTIFLAANPFVATASVLGPGGEQNPLSLLRAVVEHGEERVGLSWAERAMARVPFWVYALLALSAITVGATSVAAWGLRTPSPNP